jgi:hypothetical protein
VGDKTEYGVVLAVIKRLPSAPFFSDLTRQDLQDIAKDQVKLGYIKDYPDFAKGYSQDDSLLRGVAKKMGFEVPAN